MSRFIAGVEVSKKFFGDNTRDEAYEKIRAVGKILEYLKENFEEESHSIEAVEEILRYAATYAVQSKDWKTI